MIANLPLLFANGNPTALTKITAKELEKFITFMVTCSWGHDTAKDIRQPPWWPKDVKFAYPFVRPYEVPRDWEARLKNLVKRCYDYHKSAFLLVFSAQLSRYPRKRLRYVDNRDHTTSLYYRPSGRLLVTFRNENIFYDKHAPIELDKPQLQSTDIYLCDNCDSHFDNLDLLRAHERLCNNEVISSSSCNGGMSEFLSALKLQPVGQSVEDVHIKANVNDSRPRNGRSTSHIDRGPPYPFSSLAYMRNVKSNSQRDLTYSRDRIERYCCTSTTISKNVGSKGKSHHYPIRYRRPIDYWQRKYIFPNQRNKKILDLKAQLLLLKCRPVTVRIERMSKKEINEYIENLKREAEARYAQDKDIIFVDRLECDQSTDIDMKSMDPLKRSDGDYEVIDLCSDDESSVVNENCDPRAVAPSVAGVAGVASVTTVTGVTSVARVAGLAGVACVMRGGAVLRRTAATPLATAQPAAPCGARQRPLPAAVLQPHPAPRPHPHPVILIAHTLNNLQTISLD
ncbi:uncharacterized protein LOC113515410 [Galleria mellonella]|uniref:Uncharacterized protein LOC113515410 n=1 Tax=Galleria mellonella TaxID=7137 RepID=A0ABM3MQK1_GALME|nr:uncharacterized protein LOC113515410 [Galleria mellonella]